MYCKKCGQRAVTVFGLCSKCGERIDDTSGTTGSLSPLSNGTMTGSAAADNSIPEPSVWMYVLSVFLPVLQWILMGVYVSKGQFRSAFGLWIKPIIMQIIFCVAVLIVIKDLG